MLFQAELSQGLEYVLEVEGEGWAGLRPWAQGGGERER